MTDDFFSETSIRSVRKPRPCEGCGHPVEKGSPAAKCVGRNIDGFWSGIYHRDCRDAEVKLNTYRDYRWGDDFMALSAMELDDWPMLLEEFPDVAIRFGITQERYDEAMESRQRVYEAWKART